MAEELFEYTAGKLLFVPDIKLNRDILRQGLHDSSPELFVVRDLHWPSGQLVQEVEPGSSEYVSETQGIHTEELLAPSREEYVSAGQLIHVCELLAPSADEKVPAGQPLQTDELCRSE